MMLPGPLKPHMIKESNETGCHGKPEVAGKKSYQYHNAEGNGSGNRRQCQKDADDGCPALAAAEFYKYSPVMADDRRPPGYEHNYDGNSQPLSGRRQRAFKISAASTRSPARADLVRYWLHCLRLPGGYRCP